MTNLAHEFVEYADSPRKDFIFVHNHRSEQISFEVARRLADEKKIDFLYVIDPGQPSSHERWGKVRYKNNEYIFDPNRIYTLEGSRMTLAERNSNYNILPEDDKITIANQIFATGNQITSKLNSKTTILAFHNSRSTTMQTYRTRGYKVHESTLTPKPQTFFYVTTEQDFNVLKAKDYNVVLESANINDGGLSYWSLTNNKRYINLDSEYDAAKNEALAREVYALLSGESLP